MTLSEVLAQLESLKSGKVRDINVNVTGAKKESGTQVPSVKMGDLRVLAKQIKQDHALGLQLWDCGDIDAQLLGILLLSPKRLITEELDSMVCSVKSTQLADWLNSYVVKLHPGKEDLREGWMDSDHEMARRAGWSLTTERVIKRPEGLDLDGLLTRLESSMGREVATVQWTMNYCLAEIGINFAEHRSRAIAIGEALGLFRDYPVSKGCTSPFVPIWIAEMVRRQS
jgi:3-methyladenine DNA glycosylase AlkD